MTGKAQDRLEKLKSNLKANVASKLENVALAKTSDIKSKNKGSDVLAQAKEKQRKIREIATHTRQEAPGKCRVPDRKIHELAAQMRLKKAQTQVPPAHLPENLETRSARAQDKTSAQRRLLKAKRNKNAQHGTEASQNPSRRCPETKNGPQQGQKPPKFKIPKKPAVEEPPAAETKSAVPSSQYQSLSRANIPNNYQPAKSDIQPKTVESAKNEKLAGILKNINSSRSESAITAQHPPLIQTDKRKMPESVSTVKPVNAASAVDNKLRRNMFKRKAPGSVPDLSSRQDALRVQQRSKQDQDSHPNSGNQTHQITSQRTQGFSKESVKKPNLKPNSHKSKPTGGIMGVVSRACKGVVNVVKEAAYYSSYSGISKELQTVRRAVETVEAMDYEIISPTFEEEQVPLVQSDLYIAVDTCVVIDNLPLIKSLKCRKVKGIFTPKIVVPYQVLRELDYLKGNRTKMGYVSKNARTGIRYLMEEIDKYQFITGQPLAAALRELENFVIEIPDDHLIKCCLQLKNNGHNVMLLTNDKNLVLKAVVNLVPSWTCDDFDSSCPEHEPPQPLTPFETPPAGSFDPDLLPLANAAHQMAVLLKNFICAVLKKFLMYRFQNLWILRISGSEPWCLTVLLETIIDFWNEIASKYGARTDVKDTLLFLRRFIHKVAYDGLRYADVDNLARCCDQLALALPPSFGVEGVCFDNHLAFWKCPQGSDPPADVTFRGSCVNLTIHHMQLFENNVVQYWYGFCVSLALNLPFSHVKRELCHPAVVDLSNLAKILAAVEVMRQGLSKICDIPPGSVTNSSNGVADLWSSLVSSLGDAADRRFLIDDVVEFSNSSEMRLRFPGALQSLQDIVSFLRMALDRLHKFP